MNCVLRDFSNTAGHLYSHGFYKVVVIHQAYLTLNFDIINRTSGLLSDLELLVIKPDFCTAHCRVKRLVLCSINWLELFRVRLLFYVVQLQGIIALLE